MRYLVINFIQNYNWHLKRINGISSSILDLVLFDMITREDHALDLRRIFNFIFMWFLVLQYFRSDARHLFDKRYRKQTSRDSGSVASSQVELIFKSEFMYFIIQFGLFLQFPGQLYRPNCCKILMDSFNCIRNDSISF